jgi:hypothetical protein
MDVLKRSALASIVDRAQHAAGGSMGVLLA